MLRQDHRYQNLFVYHYLRLNFAHLTYGSYFLHLFHFSIIMQYKYLLNFMPQKTKRNCFKKQKINKKIAKKWHNHFPQHERTNFTSKKLFRILWQILFFTTSKPNERSYRIFLEKLLTLWPPFFFCHKNVLCRIFRKNGELFFQWNSGNCKKFSKCFSMNSAVKNFQIVFAMNSVVKNFRNAFAMNSAVKTFRTIF